MQGWGAAELGEQDGVDEALGDAAAEKPVMAALGGAEGGVDVGFGGGEEGQVIIFYPFA